ncbi:MAG: hypothetical protein KAU14_05595, partial [Thermoplasmata archaeon]|nr:hypothetical protein [Thermoplasmata archaeon]
GNLTIKDGGSLTFRNATLKMNCTENGEYRIEVEDGGSFSIMDKDGDMNTTEDGSNITAVGMGSSCSAGGWRFIPSTKAIEF